MGSIDHVHALAGWHGSVIVKLASSMRRYGATPDELPALLARSAGAGPQRWRSGCTSRSPATTPHGWPRSRPGCRTWPAPPVGQPSRTLSRSAAPRRTPGATFRIRVGTALWHGVPRRGVPAPHRRRAARSRYEPATPPATSTTRSATTARWWPSAPAGARRGPARQAADPARRSPFHFARHRLPLLERPHMHTSLAVVPNGQPCPRVGDRVDVQRPLISTVSDELEWT
ncbi:MAG: hypothetical protein IPL07_02410 [Acidimicrobiaceae bacterium]|nr:hypothetical protein [Acidimicrobiaceae bacterium]